MSKNAKKAETLGMPYGTASNRLRKAIMYKYVKLANEHFCYKCGAEIESVDELSIEHKAPWEGISAELFFDLDNIAFSHIQCNRPHNHVSERTRIICPDGTSWCYACTSFLPVDEFYKMKDSTKGGKRPNGYSSICKPCNRKRVSTQK